MYNRELLVLQHSTGEKYLLLGDKRINIDNNELIEFLVNKGIKVKYEI